MNGEVYNEGDEATNPKTGQVMVFNNGAWVAKPNAAANYKAQVTPAENADAAKRVGEMAQATDVIRTLANQSTDVMQHNAKAIQNSGMDTGGIYGAPVVGGIAKWIGEQMNPDLKAMDSQSLRMASNLKANNQRLTQAEWFRYLGGVPGGENPIANNAAMNKDIQNAHAMAEAQNSFYQTWLHNRGDLAGADAAWLAYKNKAFDPSTGAFILNKPQAAPSDPNGGFKFLGSE